MVIRWVIHRVISRSFLRLSLRGQLGHLGFGALTEVVAAHRDVDLGEPVGRVDHFGLGFTA